VLHHAIDQRLERHLGLPTELLARFARITEQQMDLRGPIEARVDSDTDLPGLGVDALLVDALAPPRELYSDARKRRLREFTHGVRLASGEHVIVRLGLL
jgi:hypothetical protein